jgi:L-lactate dehydrogenase complex protein LldG
MAKDGVGPIVEDRKSTPMENPSRDAILSRIRSALETPAPRGEVVSHNVPLFPPVGDLIECLRTRLKENLVDCILTGDAESSARAISEVLAKLPPGEVFVQDTPELRAMIWPSDCPIHWSSQGAPPETSEATVTLAEMLVAATGSVVVSPACGGRAGSIVAPCHIVHAKTSQIVPDLDVAVERLYSTGMLKHSFIAFHTGASRTGDIEKVLVHGAHGPKKVIVVLETNG